MTDPITRLNAALDGRYRIEREIGEGGMATVYLAQDLKHDRAVALKVLKPELAALMGAERFLTEIKTTANLQHPHILPLFDSGEADGFLFYVMPYIEGESLRDRINRERQLPVDQAVSIARAVSGALDYAHRHDVVHRDIKPENILLHDGEPMVADFGIALAISAAGGGRLTETGLSLGTPHYMSPEQASADRDVSPRSDIYSLGCVLYEMLTGDPPHTGPTSHVILMRILTEAPRSVTDVRKSVPPNVVSAVERALEKLPADRFDSAEALRKALTDEGFRHTPPTGLQAPMTGQPTVAGASIPFAALARDLRVISIAAMAVLGLVLWISTMFSPSSNTEAELPFMVSTSLGLGLGGTTGLDIAISPAGDRIAWLEKVEEGGHRLLMRRIGTLVALEVPGGENADVPFFSPDGAWLGFRASGGALVKVSVAGGPPLPIFSPASSAERLSGPHWSDSGVIIAHGTEGIYEVPDVGGEPRLLLEDPDAAWAEMLPGGTAVVFAHRTGEVSEIRCFLLETGEIQPLVANGTHPHYLKSGHLIYGHDGQTLFAVPFDLESLTVTGDPVPVLQPVSVSSSGATQFAVAKNGTAIYVADATTLERELVELGADGSEDVLPIREGQLRDPRYSPDGMRIAYSRLDDFGLYVYSTLTGTDTLISGNYDAVYPVWAPDGATVTFGGLGTETEGWDGLRAPADGSAAPELLYARPYTNQPQAWLPDGRLLVRETHPTRGYDLLIYAFEADSVVETPYLTANWEEEAPSLSPDGDWVAYSSTESGRGEVYVRAFPRASEKIRVSRDGGGEPRWSPDGRTLYYREGTSLVAANLGPGPGIEEARSWTTVHPGEDHFLRPQFAQFDVHPDGDRFLVVRTPEDREPGQDELVVVLNWFRVMEERMRITGGG